MLGLQPVLFPGTLYNLLLINCLNSEWTLGHQWRFQHPVIRSGKNKEKALSK